MLFAQTSPEVETVSAMVARHGITAVILAVILGAFLWGVYYLLTKAVPALIAGIRADHAATLELFRLEQERDRELYQTTVAQIVARLDQICARLEALEKKDDRPL